MYRTFGADLPGVPGFECGDFANATLVGSASATARQTSAVLIV
jgi:hypothetical protein